MILKKNKLIWFQNHRPERGPPTIGKAIKVKWTDGSLYGATFRGTNQQDMYRVGLFIYAGPSAGVHNLKKISTITYVLGAEILA